MWCVSAEYQFRNATYEERLLAYLFSDYDPVARAVVDTDDPVVVCIDFVLLRIHGLVCLIRSIDSSRHTRRGTDYSNDYRYLLHGFVTELRFFSVRKLLLFFSLKTN